MISAVTISLFLYEPMGSREIFHTFSLLVEIEGHFTHGFVTYDHYFPFKIKKDIDENASRKLLSHMLEHMPLSQQFLKCWNCTG
jgi:hypothetical protein